jgi:peptide/nickel transport system ATP-binding protein
MYLGEFVEHGDVDEIFDDPQHPYTRALLSAIPVPDPDIERTRERIVLQGDLPSPADRRDGCSFTSRCPLYKMLPKNSAPAARPWLRRLHGSDAHANACHWR